MNKWMTRASPSILVIDDAEPIHRLLKIRLATEKYDIHSALTSSDGLAMAKEVHPDLILLDLRIDDEMDGLQVLQRLKDDEATSGITVIFISGESDGDQRVKALDLGAVDFITKPFDEFELRARLRCQLRAQRTLHMLEQRAQVDGLTELWNRAYFDQRLRAEVAEARRHSRPLSIVMTDIDRFKPLNDTFGHPFGDKVLEQFGRILSHGRASDIACRFGGDEFAVILPHTGLREAREVAERYRVMMQEQVWTIPPHAAAADKGPVIVTVSLGVADLASCGEHAGRTDLVRMADQALYAAKGGSGGAARNRVVSADELCGESIEEEA